MKKKSSRIVALVLTLCMVFFGLPVAAMAEGNVAQIEGGKAYTTLNEAITKAQDGETVRLLTDTSLSSYINIQKSIKLDINGNTITSTNGLAFAVSENATFTITDNSNSKNGEIESTKKGNCNLLEVSSGEIIVENGNLSNDWYVIYVYKTGKATIKGGTLTSSVASVLSTNGSKSGENYSADAVMNVEGGNLVSNNDVTIYLPAGTLNITGGEIVGATAVYSKCGVTNISGNPVIKGEGNKENFQHTGNGCYPTGDAMVVEACNYPNGNPEVYISGGTFTSKNGASVAYYQHENNEAEKFSITGGTFSSDVSDYVSSGYECKEDSDTQKWVVNEMTPGEMVVKPETGDDNSASATLDGVYTGQGTSITTEGSSSSEDNETDVAEDATVTVDLTKENTTTSATLTVTDVAAASLSSAPSLTVKTDAGDVTLPEDALKKVAEAGEGGNDVTVTVTKETTPADAKAAYTVKVEANGENLLPASASDNGDITITVEKPESASTLEAWYAVKNDSGTWLPVEQLDSGETADGKLAITITHLSTVILYSTTPSSSTVATVKTGNTETAYGNFSDALDAANKAGDGSVITLWKDVPVTTSSALKIQEDITITSAKGVRKTITLTNGQEQDRAKMIVMSADLTLDNVALTLMPTANGNGDGIQMDNDQSDPVTLTLQNGAVLKFANNDDESVQNAFVMPAGAGAKVIVNNSEIIAKGVDGNFSNGGIFTIRNGSTVKISNCDSYALSVNGLTVDASTLTITDTKLSAIRTAGRDSVVSVVNGGEIIVERCGESLPNDSKWSYAEGVIDLGHLKDKGTKVPAILNVDNDSSITLNGNENKDGKEIDYVYLTNSVSNLNRGSVTGIVQEEGLPENYCKVTYTVNNEIDVVIRAEISADKRITFTEPDDPVVSGYTFQGWNYPESANVEAGTVTFPVEDEVFEYTVTANLKKKPASSTSDDTPSPGYRLPYISETTGGKNFVSDTTSNLTVNGKYQFRITSTDGHKPVMTVSNANFTVELASQSGNDYFYVIRCAGAAGSTANVLVDGIHVVVATVGTAGVVSDTTHPFTVAQGATYQFKLTSASRPTFTGNNANFTIAYVSNSGNDWFFKVTAVGAAGASTTFSANGVVVTTATIA